MKSIWKFPFEVNDYVSIEMPKGARILCVQTQNEIPCIWAVVDKEAEREYRQFYLFGTGHPFDGDPDKYVGSFQLRDGQLIFHLFETN